MNRTKKCLFLTVKDAEFLGCVLPRAFCNCHNQFISASTCYQCPQYSPIPGYRKNEITEFTVCAEGDSSVGMFPIQIQGRFDGLSLGDDIERGSEDGRKEFRKALEKLFSDFLDYGKVTVTFKDECIDCGKIGCKGECLTEPLPPKG